MCERDETVCEGYWYEMLCEKCQKLVDNAANSGEAKSMFGKQPEEWGFCGECLGGIRNHMKELDEAGMCEADENHCMYCGERLKPTDIWEGCCSMCRGVFLSNRCVHCGKELTQDSETLCNKCKGMIRKWKG